MQNLDKIIEKKYPLRDAIRKLETSIYRCKEDVVSDMFHAKSELERLDKEGGIDKVDIIVVNSHLA